MNETNEGETMITTTSSLPVVHLPVSPERMPHTPDRPFCTKWGCACHKDGARITRYLEEPFLAGLLTIEEVARILSGGLGF